MRLRIFATMIIDVVTVSFESNICTSVQQKIKRANRALVWLMIIDGRLLGLVYRNNWMSDIECNVSDKIEHAGIARGTTVRLSVPITLEYYRG